MNTLEIQMMDLLKEMKRDYGVVELKTEFEAEAVRIPEAMRLKDIANKAGLGLVIKIGGAEAITDMFEAQHIGITGLVAPMVETEYAMKKYIEAVKNYFSDDLRQTISFGINIETITAYKNMIDILTENKAHTINKVTLGRVDMCGSMDIPRDQINCKELFKIAVKLFKYSKNAGLKTAMGGGIAKQAIGFITALVDLFYLDYYETRKVVFDTKRSIENIEKGIVLANKFELMWLQNKKNYYGNIFKEDDKRIIMLKERLT